MDVKIILVTGLAVIGFILYAIDWLLKRTPRQKTTPVTEPIHVGGQDYYWGRVNYKPKLFLKRQLNGELNYLELSDEEARVITNLDEGKDD